MNKIFAITIGLAATILIAGISWHFGLDDVSSHCEANHPYANSLLAEESGMALVSYALPYGCTE